MQVVEMSLPWNDPLTNTQKQIQLIVISRYHHSQVHKPFSLCMIEIKIMLYFTTFE